MTSMAKLVMWQQMKKGGTIPIGRSSHTLNAVQGKIFVFSGENTPRVPIDNAIQCYNIANQAWEQYATTGPSPCARIAASSASVGNKIFLFGGRTGITMDEGPQNDMHVLDVDTATWSEVNMKGDIPCGRSYHSMVSHGTMLYVFGGCTEQGRMNDLHSFDTGTSTWEKLPTNANIIGRGGPGLAATSDSVYVFAGFPGKEIDDMYKYDIATKTWQTMNPLPNIPPVSVFASATLGSKIILHAGETTPSDQGHEGAGAFSNLTYCFDTGAPNNGWVQMEQKGDVPPPRGWTPAARLSDTEMVLFGGNSHDNSRLDDLYIMTMQS